ncbi:MAG TPA: ComEC/Rec2 family competence protein [Treponemataceae bacterium]|nr:ComEC/Rec2 family competence protein [Treponemataceae bacterium]
MPFKQKNFSLSFIPVELAAITIALLIYSGLCTPVNRTTFLSLLPSKSITYIEGVIVSNPVKTSSQRYYSMELKTSYTSTHFPPQWDKGVFSKSTGTILLLVNTKEVEGLFPGKLYSNSKNTARGAARNVEIYEKGAKLKVNTNWLQPDSTQIQKKSIFSSPYTKTVFIAKDIEHCGWISMLAKTRAQSRLIFRRILFLWGDAGGLLLALLSGTREYTNQTLSEAFRNAGLAHILALSGMHLSLFAGLAKKIGTHTGGKKFSTFLAPLLIILFVWFAGISPSLFRALLCTYIGMIASLCYINTRFSAVLALSFLLQVSFFPQDAFSAAFILSYGALGGIIIGEKIFLTINNRFFPTCISSGLTASQGAQLCTAPITASLFGSIMPIGIISSVIISPLASVFLVFGLCCILLAMAVPVLMQPLGYAVQFLYSIVEYLVLFFAQFPKISF